MNLHQVGRPHRRGAAAVLVAALVGLLGACLPAPVTGGQQLTAMTRNLYLGTGLRDVFEATSLPEFVAAGARNWANVRANDFPARAEALADEIAHARPDVVGLQEVTLWREQAPGDLLTDPRPNATRVVLDLLATLQDALDRRGTPYTALATSTNADLELPRPGLAGLVDLRVTDRDVLLVRADRVERFGNPRTGHYGAVLHLPVVGGTVANTRGWAGVDYRPDGDTTVRILTTHLEVAGGAAGAIQERQARELVALVRASPHPVVVLGDMNSPARGSATSTYEQLTAVLADSWVVDRPADPGPTCCQSEVLTDPESRAVHRIDLVLVPHGWPVDRVVRTGAEPFRSGPPPLWASDHFGVSTRITIPN